MSRKMFKAVAVVAVMVCLGLHPVWGDVIDDDFPGTTLSSTWNWVNEDSCSGSVNDGLTLNPVTQWRRASIGSTGTKYSWAELGNPVTYQFTVSSWNFTSNSGVKAGMYLVGDDAGTQPETWSHYNKPNVLQFNLDLWEGTFYLNLFEKTNQASVAIESADKLSYMTIGSSVDGYTFGFTADGTSGYLWYKEGDGTYHQDSGVTLESSWFDENGNVYVFADNQTGGDLGGSETIEFSNVAVIPEPGVAALGLLGGLFIVRMLRRRK